MMGRSHAMLGVVGYLALTPIAKITSEGVTETIDSISCAKTDNKCFVFRDVLHGAATPLTMERSTLVIVVVSALILTVLYPSIVRRLFGREFSEGVLYRILQVFVVTFGSFLIVQWLYQSGYQHLFPDTPLEYLVWGFAAAGFAVIPDLDEPNSTISRLFGPVSRGFAAVTRVLAGGHRYATHSWIMVVLGFLLALAAQKTFVVMGIVLMCAYVLASRLVLPDKVRIGVIPLLIGAAFVAWLISVGSIDPSPMLLALPVGILLHDLGDWVTNSGIAFTYPSRRKYAAKLFSTNGEFEHYFVQPVLSLAVTAMALVMIVLPTARGEGFGDFTLPFDSLPSIQSVINGSE